MAENIWKGNFDGTNQLFIRSASRKSRMGKLNSFLTQKLMKIPWEHGNYNNSLSTSINWDLLFCGSHAFAVNKNILASSAVCILISEIQRPVFCWRRHWIVILAGHGHDRRHVPACDGGGGDLLDDGVGRRGTPAGLVLLTESRGSPGRPSKVTCLVDNILRTVLRCELTYGQWGSRPFSLDYEEDYESH